MNNKVTYRRYFLDIEVRKLLDILQEKYEKFVNRPATYAEVLEFYSKIDLEKVDTND